MSANALSAALLLGLLYAAALLVAAVREPSWEIARGSVALLIVAALGAFLAAR